MYNLLKKILFFFISKKQLINNEAFFRNIYAFFYKGNKHECSICNTKLKSFITQKNGDLICPNCGSLSRQRRLWILFNKENQKGNVLHFSPSRSLYRKLNKKNNINYFSSDFENEFIADHHFDITNIKQEDNKFDTIICYHILEHIENDTKAISELYRVLKPSGKAYIQTPFKTGDIYEDASITEPSDREKHFGQQDHVRIYSVNGLKNRLTKGGFSIETKTFSEDENSRYYGLQSYETILIASK